MTGTAETYDTPLHRSRPAKGDHPAALPIPKSGAMDFAILGLVGYQEMKNLARQAAVQTARDEIRSHPAATAPASRRAVSGNPVGDPSDRKRVPS